MRSLAGRIDSNIAHYERALRELPSAELSITLPILLVGLEPDEATPVVDVSQSGFGTTNELVGRKNSGNLWRVVNGWRDGARISDVGPSSAVGPRIELFAEEVGDERDKCAVRARG